MVCEVHHPDHFIREASESEALLALSYMVCTFATFINLLPISQCAVGGACRLQRGVNNDIFDNEWDPCTDIQAGIAFP